MVWNLIGRYYKLTCLLIEIPHSSFPHLSTVLNFVGYLRYTKLASNSEKKRRQLSVSSLKVKLINKYAQSSMLKRILRHRKQCDWLTLWQEVPIPCRLRPYDYKEQDTHAWSFASYKTKVFKGTLYSFEHSWHLKQGSNISLESYGLGLLFQKHVFKVLQFSELRPWEKQSMGSYRILDRATHSKIIWGMWIKTCTPPPFIMAAEKKTVDSFEFVFIVSFERDQLLLLLRLT